jgi:hypothetical protein
MDKISIFNSFHGTKKTFSIKQCYLGKDPDFDALAALDYEIYSHGADISYAKRKLKEIKNALCGVTDCRCVNVIKKRSTQ